MIFLHCNKGFRGEEGRSVKGNRDYLKCVFLMQRNSVSILTLGDQGLCNGSVMGRALANFTPKFCWQISTTLPTVPYLWRPFYRSLQLQFHSDNNAI